MIVQYLFAILIGLIIGSFANVLLYRLPIMLDGLWPFSNPADSGDIDQQTAAINSPQLGDAEFNLALPASHCPVCQHRLRWYENIPLLSYLVLRGRCSHCQAPISWQYPVIEIACAAIFVLCTWRYGFGLVASAWALFLCASLVLFILDFQYYFLPDVITLSLLWMGLLFASLGLNSLTDLQSAVWGAALGYLLLWSVYWLFKLATGKEGMGFGDFKLLAAVGAWLGWQAIVPVLLIASLLGVVMGSAYLRFSQRERKSSESDIPANAIAFGPYLILATVSLWCFPQLKAWLWTI